MKTYDTAIIGAGAAGLFAGACLAEKTAGRTVILEKGRHPGRKLLMAGSGQCNLTHNGSAKDFIGHYGSAGKKIRTIIYHYSNAQVISFFEGRGCPLLTREDGKVFPRSLQGSDVLNTLVQSCLNGSLEFRYSAGVVSVEAVSDGFRIVCEKTGPPGFAPNLDQETELAARRVIVATGGCSYPTTGSDGGFFSVLSGLGLEIVEPRPALVPIHVEGYPYAGLSGISFPSAGLTLSDGKSGRKLGENRDGLLLTHRCFSGPAVLNISRLARPGQRIAFSYLPGQNRSETELALRDGAAGSSRQTATLLCSLFPSLPRRFLETLCRRAGVDPSVRASGLAGSVLKTLAALLTEDGFSVSGTEGFSTAMVTAGGVSLSEIDTKTMECRRIPGLYIVGEALDADGDTGGYNLQFAFSSAHLAAASVSAELI